MALPKQSPIYQQIIMHFEERILSGALKPGDRLDSTTALARKFDVNPETIQLALGKLAERGIIDLNMQSWPGSAMQILYVLFTRFSFRKDVRLLLVEEDREAVRQWMRKQKWPDHIVDWFVKHNLQGPRHPPESSRKAKRPKPKGMRR